MNFSRRYRIHRFLLLAYVSNMATASSSKNLKQLLTYDIWIGGGAFGEVFGPCSWNGETCAVKRLFAKDDDCEKLEKERKACDKWMSLHHQNLVTVYDVIFESRTLFIVMEYGSGGSLRSALQRCTSALSGQLLTNWGIQIAQGMAYLHQNKIVHRDLKSHNGKFIIYIFLTYAFVSSACIAVGLCDAIFHSPCYL